MPLLFATTNLNKVRELREIFAPYALELDGLDSLPDELPEPVEDGDTFAANAQIKAAAYARASGRRCLAEDSGLVVDALDGAPGVYSARYAALDEADGSKRADRDAANNRKLLAAMAQVPDDKRSARFVCAMCVCDPDGSVIATTRGTFEGSIARAEHGAGGFGYDPLLWVAELQRTSAQLSPAEKNARSHRGEAARKLAPLLAQLAG